MKKNLKNKSIVIQTGGSIGEYNSEDMIPYKGTYGKIIDTFDNHEDAIKFAARKRKSLSPGEKHYYKIRYYTLKK